MHTHDKTGQVTGKTRCRPARVPTPVALGGVPLGRRVNPRRPILRLRANADRALIEATVAALIDLLDARDAPMMDREPDLYRRDDADMEPDFDGEEDNEDRCSARDDEPRAGTVGYSLDHRPGAEDDAESSLGWPGRPGRNGAFDQSMNTLGDNTSEREHDRCDDEEDADGEPTVFCEGEAPFAGATARCRRDDPAVMAARARHAAKPRPVLAGAVWL